MAHGNARSRWQKRARSQRVHAVMDKGRHRRLDHRSGNHHRPIFRSINKRGRITGERMTAQRIFDAVKLYGSKIGVPDLAQHDLQRTFGKLANKGPRSAGTDPPFVWATSRSPLPNVTWACDRTSPIAAITWG